MTYLAIHNGVRKHINDNFTDVTAKLTPADVVYDNTGYNKHKATDLAAWVRVQILLGDADGLNLGSDEIRTGGILLLSIFTTAGTGDKLALEVAGEIVTACNRKTIKAAGAIIFLETPAVYQVGREGAWYQTNVSVPLRSDNAK